MSIEDNKTFLQTYLSGASNSIKYEPWESGFLRLQYGSRSELIQVAFVHKIGDKPKPKQLQLYFMLINGMVSFTSASALSGMCWSNGYVDWGTVWDDDGCDDGSNAKKYELEVWIEECLNKMVLQENQL